MTALFNTITSEDRRRSIAYRWMRPNAIRLAIQQITAARVGAPKPERVWGDCAYTGEQPTLARGNLYPVPSATSPHLGSSRNNDAKPATAAGVVRRDAQQA